MIENFAGWSVILSWIVLCKISTVLFIGLSDSAECNMVKRAASAGRKQPPQVLLFSASFECLEPSHPFAKRAKDFTDLIIDRSLRVPIVIRVTSNELKLENVTQFFVQVCAYRHYYPRL